MNTMHGAPVKTVNISGKPYVTVAERSRFAHETFGENAMLGYEVTGRDVFSLGDRHFMTVYILINGKRYCGTSEIQLSNAKAGSADAKAPIECAETSAVGRALAFAGIGVVDDLASADEMVRAGVKPDVSPAPRTPREAINILKGVAQADHLAILVEWCKREGIDKEALRVYYNAHQYSAKNQAHAKRILDDIQADDTATRAELHLMEVARQHGIELKTLLDIFRGQGVTGGMNGDWNAYDGNRDDWDAVIGDAIGQTLSTSELIAGENPEE